jgi:hypothetical protein
LKLVFGIFVGETKPMVVYSCDGEGANRAIQRSAQNIDMVVTKHTVTKPS